MRAILASLLGFNLFVSAVPAAPLKPGVEFKTKSASATLLKLQSLPFVDDDYTRRFSFDVFENQKLRQLREQYKLQEVVAAGKGEFEQQVLLMDWTHRQFKSFGRPTTNAFGALQVLNAIGEGQTFFCSQYAQVFVSAAASLGWIDRPLALRRHQDSARDGSTEHSSTEIWSNQYGKWVMLDPTSNMYLEKDGIPLNAYEIRQEWFYENGTRLTFVIGKERKRFRKQDLPIFLKTFPKFGNLEIGREELDKYGFTGYIPNNNLMDAGFDYGKMFIVKDKLCDGTKWHVRTLPANPGTDPYFPLNQASLELLPEGDQVRIRVSTFTPNFSHFEQRRNGQAWENASNEILWPLRRGFNQIEIRALNKFGVTGPVSEAVIRVD